MMIRPMMTPCRTPRLPLSHPPYLALLETSRAWLQTLGYRPATRQMTLDMQRECLHWLESEGQLALHHIDNKVLTRYLEHLRTRPKVWGAGRLSSVMLAHHTRSVQLLFNYLEQTGRLVPNPASALPKPRPVSARKTPLTVGEVQRLYDASETYLELALLAIYYGCGLRRNEGILLTPRHLNLESGWLHVHHGKGGMSRSVPMAPQVQRQLRSWLQEARPPMPETDALLLKANGLPLNGGSANRLLQRLALRAGIDTPVTLHLLRHTIATHLLQKGLPLQRVSQFLGHRCLDSTQRYTHL